MSTARKPLVTLAASAALALAACSSDSGALPDSGAAPDASGTSDGGGGPDAGLAAGRVLLESDTVDFGAVVVTSTETRTLSITNPGDGPVRVTLSEPAGPDASLFRRSVNVPSDDGSFTLEARGVATLTISVAPSDLGPRVAVIALDSCGGTCPSAILLLGEGVRTGLECPTQVDLGLANPGSCVDRPVVCTNRGNATERITVAELDPRSASELSLVPPALPVDLAPGAGFTASVRFCPTAAVGSAGDLLVATFRPFETEHVIHLTATGGGADLTCDPASLDFGVVGVGGTARQDVRCQNRGAIDATVAGVVTGSGFALATAPSPTLEPGDTATFTVEVTATTAGPITGELVITSNDPDSPQLTVPLAAEAIIADPCTAAISPEEVDFGLVGLGERRTAEVTISNLGASTCLIRQAALAPGTNPTFSLVNAPASGASIGPGQFLQVIVAFAPTTNAVASGALEVSFANPGTTELGATLAGTGGLASVSVSPSSLDFGTVPIGCAEPARRRIRLQRINPGSGPVTSVQLVTTGELTIDTSAIPATLAFGEVLELVVGFQPTSAGRQSGELQILAGGTPTPILVPITGEGGSGPQVTETFSFDPPVVDVLFVVDDSSGMRGAQAALASAMPHFVARLAERGADFHFGVITMDMEDGARSGRLIGTPPFVDATEPSPNLAIGALVAPGTDGADETRGVEAVLAAVTPPLSTGPNAGFLRPDADLAVVFVTNSEDTSQGAPALGSVVASLRAASGTGRVILSAIAGPEAGCTGPTGTAEPSTRYAQMVLRAGGTLHSICGDLSAAVEEITAEVLGAARFELAGDPRYSTLDVEVDGGAVPRATWEYEAASNRVIFLDEIVVPNGAEVAVTYDQLCVSPTCGDGVTGANEDCDDANQDDTDDCSTTCISARCGDGVLRAAAESCDDANLDDSDECLSTCALPVCGDGIVREGVEECDDGNTESGDGCPSNCRFYTSSGIVPEQFAELDSPIPITMGSSSGDPNDDGFAVITLPFSFTYWDVPTSSLTVSVNGLVGIGPIEGEGSYTNTGFPDAADPNGIIAAWWEDLYFDQGITGAQIAYEVLGTEPNRSVVIQWRRIRVQGHSTNNNRRFSFQIALFEGTGEIALRYGETETSGNPPTATTASAGLEDPTGSLGLELLGCSPACDGRSRPGSATGFPRQTTVRISP